MGTIIKQITYPADEEGMINKSITYPA